MPHAENGFSRFEKLVVGVIVLNAVLVAAAWLIDGHEELFEMADNAILAFFVFELLVRLHHAGWHPKVLLREPWIAFDAVVIALCFLPTLGTDVALLRFLRIAKLGKAAKVVHLTRHANHLRSLGG